MLQIYNKNYHHFSFFKSIFSGDNFVKMCLLCAQEKIKGGAAIKVRRPQLRWWWSKRRKTDDPYLHAPLHSANERERESDESSLYWAANKRLQLQTQPKLRNSSIYLRTIISTCPALGFIFVAGQLWCGLFDRKLSAPKFFTTDFFFSRCKCLSIRPLSFSKGWLRDWNSILCCSRACRLSVLCAITAAITPSLL